MAFADLLIAMRAVLKQRGYKQVPQLSSSNQVDLKREPFSVWNAQKNGSCRALVIGINYVGQKGELRGCVNDAKMMVEYLRSQGYPDNCIRILADEAGFGHNPPTKRNIFDCFTWLVEGAKAGDSLFLHYSGHGGQMPDDNGDEKDGMDETLIPADYKQAGMIRDDLIYEMLLAGLPAGAQLVCVFDCCHSGTILDLPYVFVIDGSGEQQLQSQASVPMKPNANFNLGAVLAIVKEFQRTGKVPWSKVAPVGLGVAKMVFKM